MSSSSSTGLNFELPDPVLAALPSDPFEQLDVARKITSIALATRVSKLEDDAARLHQKIAEKEDLIADLEAHVQTLDSSLADASGKLAKVEADKESLLNENASLSKTVKKLTRDVAKLEVFRKTLMQSLQDEEDTSNAAVPSLLAKEMTTGSLSGSTIGVVTEEDAMPPPVKSSSIQNPSATGSFSEDIGSVEMEASQTSTPRLTPPDSPTRLSASASPSPSPSRRSSMSFSSSKSVFDDRSSMFSSIPSSQHGSISGSLETGSQTVRGRVDGKEFFRQVRSRLSYEQFGAFLANVKELNSRKQTREETLRKANEIFGPENKDLYTIFEGLITRTVH
ncbi:hypothetical protein ACLOJK_018100 [Asimina triloba]